MTALQSCCDGCVLERPKIMVFDPLVARLFLVPGQLTARKAEPFGKHVVFSGFDGNNESEHHSIAIFLTRDLERFSFLENRDLNSHIPSIDTYRRMLAVFEPMRRTLTGGELNVTQIIELMKARVHPEFRET